jgi:Zn finger protein HypA/HybF involved in hydrogenase expression
MSKHPYQYRTILVRCNNCKKDFDENKIEFLNISENIFGQDELTFECPICKTTQTSLRRG